MNVMNQFPILYLPIKSDWFPIKNAKVIAFSKFCHGQFFGKLGWSIQNGWIIVKKVTVAFGLGLHRYLLSIPVSRLKIIEFSMG